MPPKVQYRGKGRKGKKNNNNNNNNNKNNSSQGATSSTANDSKNNNTNNNNGERKEPFHWRRLADDASIATEAQEKLKGFLTKINGNMDEAYHQVIDKELTDIVRQAATLQSDQPKELLSYLEWHPCAQQMKEGWKPEVVSNAINGIGYKIGTKKGRRAPDDKLYLQNPDLQENLPRGLVFTRDNKGRVELVLFSNRKFYGKSHGDDDDSDVCSHALREGRFKHFIVSDKANGESSQLSMLTDGETFVIGSKNRKIACRVRSDVEKYRGEQMYSYAVEMAECFFDDYYAKMDDQTKKDMKSFFQTTRLTMNFEFESPLHQHLVPLFKRRMCMIGLTGIHVGGNATHPCLGAAVARWFGFASVIETTKLHDKSELSAVCDAVHRQWELEGSVLVLLDDNMRVVDLVKVKTWWYIILRATREKFRQLRGQATLARQCRLIKERLSTLERAMKIDSTVIARFKELCTAFAAWMVADSPNALSQDVITAARQSDRSAGNLKKLRLEQFHQDQYPLLWRKFLNDSNLPIDSSLLGKGEVKHVKLEERPLPLLVLLQGIPGLGKSALAQAVIKPLEDAGIKSAQCAQDDFAHLGGKKSGPACFAHVRSLLEDNKHQLVLLARNNANRQQYQKYTALQSDGTCRVAFITPLELTTLNDITDPAGVPQSLDKLLYMCVASVLYRKQAGDDNQPHPTNVMTRPKLAGLPFTFLNMFESHPAAIPISVLNESAVNPPPAFCAKVRAVLGLSTSDDNDSSRKGKRKAVDAISEADLSAWGLDDAKTVEKVMKDGHILLDDLAQTLAKALIDRVADDNQPVIGSYLGCTLTMEAATLVVEKVGPFAKGWNTYGDHITLVHSFNYDRDRDLWLKAKKMTGIGVKVTPKKLYLITEKHDSLPQLAALSVSLETEDGTVIDDLVGTKEPHITIACAPGVRAYQSAGAITKAREMNQLKEVPVDLGVLESTLELTVPQ